MFTMYEEYYTLCRYCRKKNENSGSVTCEKCTIVTLSQNATRPCKPVLNVNAPSTA